MASTNRMAAVVVAIQSGHSRFLVADARMRLSRALRNVANWSAVGVVVVCIASRPDSASA